MTKTPVIDQTYVKIRDGSAGVDLAATLGGKLSFGYLRPVVPDLSLLSVGNDNGKPVIRIHRRKPGDI